MSLPQPTFGEPLPIKASPEALRLLSERRSSSAAMLAAPAPSPEQLETLLRLAVRVPDHGKLSPWRFIVLQGEAKAAYVEALRRIAADHDQPEAALVKVAAPSLSVAVISRPTAGKIPLWEQELSAGAVCMTMLIAAEALGFGANWITDWYAVEPHALALLGVTQGERVAAFIHLGTPTEPPLERVRPELGSLVSRWAPPA